uniref:ABC transporter domain-containing protein n=1 Tax=Angiostrongylus cantonensis TaxID=6313 RepID=A0A158PAR8_ANGCA
MEKVCGYIGRRGTFAYVPQQSWIRNTTLRDNIIMGKTFDRNFYERVIEACALDEDLKQLPNGDRTEIGEKGINLSGGQKARVALARAIYQDRDVYLLDDPLSAVDAHVSKHIFTNVIGSEGLLKCKTRILVTHALSFLKDTDIVVVMRGGSITHTATYDSLRNSDVSEIIQESPHGIEESPNSESSEISNSDDNEDELDADEKYFLNKELGNLIEKEEIALGRVKFSVYMVYLKSIGILRYFVPFVVALVLNSVFLMARNLWLSDWSNDNIPEVDKGLAKPLGIRLGIYALFGILEVVFLYLALSALILGAVVASLKLHKPLLHNILRSPLSHFDVTPLGRILNRLGKDMEVVDLRLSSSFRFLAIAFMSVLQTCIIISISTPLFIVVIIPIFVIYLLVLHYFIPCSRQLQRLTAISRSPIYSHFDESIQATSLLAVMSRDWGTMSAGAIGLSVSYSLSITFMLNFFMRQLSEIETNIVAVERIKEYTETAVEAPWRCRHPPPIDWPRGEISIYNYSARYRPGLDLVIKDVTVHISPVEKIGLVGRTGSGKSSLVLALFRIIEPASGKILIDGVDITTIGLHDLRERLTIIPQDPVLFSGTLRFNLDPIQKHTDAELWSAIEHANLKHFVQSFPLGFQHQVDECGHNISAGQRQLICLTRALMRKSRLIVLDEATASVDSQTDMLIQTTIRSQFSSSTIITIAHRLNTIFDYDRVLVMDAGRVAEFDTPQQLLARNSIFRSMAINANLM